jgi:hypothetical protein
MNSKESGEHLATDMLVRAVEEELSAAERIACDVHLATCETCRGAMEEWRAVSAEIRRTVNTIPVPDPAAGRRRLEAALEVHSTERPSRVLRRFGWGMALAASLAIGILLAPKRELKVDQTRAEHMAQPSTIDVDGETFLPLPYSNPDLPVSAHIVQMQVPVSSLADAGIELVPAMNRTTEGEADQSVLADVLIGADGQPRGIHVLGME